ncbi:hypothetical protein [Acidisphaera rubrifaciens]|uniref:Uncharacterized protein n=1 Tax=Acidisphaera rubrifaciens HS-AP3 TaxID=1231350 RepID=A0A0D6P7N9_9PROT|nr:hypothetical protein [Acidisphaera rubrifaciens]GAN77361.1 hypothetical protein Asru_0291_05 [Acidisphaera rubrifaciens HS-AP3]
MTTAFDVGPASGSLPMTQALRRRLGSVTNDAQMRDLLYLEAWERDPQPGAGAALRINQIRRANPELAAEIRAELSHPLRPA